MPHLPHRFRPLAFYIGTEALALLMHVGLTLWGFQLHAIGGHQCYTRGVAPRWTADAAPAGGSGASSCCGASDGGGSSSARSSMDGSVWETGSAAGDGCEPILLMHGVGLGPLPYVGFLMHLMSTGGALLGHRDVECGVHWQQGARGRRSGGRWKHGGVGAAKEH